MARRTIDRRKAFRAARRLVEAVALEGAFDATLSLVLDALITLEESMTDTLSPDDFDFAECAHCHQPTPVPLTHLLRPGEPGEPDVPVRFVVHEQCRHQMGDAVEPPDEDTA